MESISRHIEIFGPFGEAYELTKKILFQPFNLTKWFVIGFAAWLATFFSGTSFNYNKARNWKGAGQQSFTFPAMDHWSAWAVILVVLAAGAVLALAILFLWLNARGRFIFLDCIVRNRGAIAAPWREYRAEANSFFLFQLIIAGCALLVFGATALVFFMSYRRHDVLPITLLVLLVAAWILFAAVLSLVSRFMVAVMYRRRCGAMEAFRDVWSLLFANLWIVILFELFLIVLYVAALMASCAAGCVTCCLAMLPYLGTVILLPVVMLLFAFPLCFLRQFGDSYDVWAGASASPQIPPVQENLPPA
jgi:hypothetical protein